MSDLRGGLDSKEAEELRQEMQLSKDEAALRELHRRRLLNQHNNAKYSRAKYRETHMLLIHFECEKYNLIHGLYQLKSVLEKSYAIITRVIVLPRIDSSKSLRHEIQTFIHRYSAPDILLLVYYAGHASGTGEGAGRMTLGLLNNVDWFDHYRMLDNCISDVLIFLECNSVSLNVQHTMSLAHEELVKNRNALAGRTDVIATCGTGNRAPGEPYSLTTMLVWTFRGLAHTEDFTTTDLENSMVSGEYLPDELREDRDKFPEICFSRLHSPSRDRDIRIMPFKLKGGLYSHSSDSRHASFLQPYGPLGRPPLEWEKRFDGYSRVYIEAKSVITYATRPWRSTGTSCETQLWQPERFRDRCQLDAYGVFKVSLGLEIFTRRHLEILKKDINRESRTAMDAYAEWITEFEADDENDDWINEFMEILDEEAAENPEASWPFMTSTLP